MSSSHKDCWWHGSAATQVHLVSDFSTDQPVNDWINGHEYVKVTLAYPTHTRWRRKCVKKVCHKNASASSTFSQWANSCPKIDEFSKSNSKSMFYIAIPFIYWCFERKKKKTVTFFFSLWDTTNFWQTQFWNKFILSSIGYCNIE